MCVIYYLFVAVVSNAVAPPGINRARIAGVLFQLAGLALVVVGILRAWRKFKPRGVHINVPAATTVVQVFAPEVRAGHYSVASRVITWLRTRLAERSVDTEKTAPTGRGDAAQIRIFAAHHSKTRAELRALSQRLEDFAAGGLRLEAVGVFWLAIGMLLGSLPEDSVTALLRFLPVLGGSASGP